MWPSKYDKVCFQPGYALGPAAGAHDALSDPQSAGALPPYPTPLHGCLQRLDSLAVVTCHSVPNDPNISSRTALAAGFLQTKTFVTPTDDH